MSTVNLGHCETIRVRVARGPDDFANSGLRFDSVSVDCESGPTFTARVERAALPIAQSRARLFAAAPDLLVALEDFIRLASDSSKFPTHAEDAILNARAAIARAKGTK